MKKARNDVSEKSDNKSSSSVVSDKESKDPKCDYCLQTSASNRNGEPEDLLICKDCQAKGGSLSQLKLCRLFVLPEVLHMKCYHIL